MSRHREMVASVEFDTEDEGVKWYLITFHNDPHEAPTTPYGVTKSGQYVDEDHLLITDNNRTEWDRVAIEAIKRLEKGDVD